MKILLIDVNYKYSSTGQLVYQLHQYLHHCGHQSLVCYGRGKTFHDRDVIKFGLDWETYIHALLTRVTGYTGYFSFLSTKRLIKCIDNFQPDIIHIHEMHAYFVNIRMLLKYIARKRIKTVFTLHCEFDYTGKCGHSMECEKWKTVCGNCPHLKDYPRVLWFDQTRRMHLQKKKLFANLPDATITTVSPWLRKRAEQSFLKNHAFETIYNGIDINVFHQRSDEALRKKLGLESEKIVISVAPHIMSKEKGGHFIEELAQRNKDIAFILVGTDESCLKRKANIIYVPKVSERQELAAYYSISNVFVITSLKETFSLTCAEALCCGIPVVGFECGAPEMIFEEPYASFVPYGDIEGLEDKMLQKILKKPEKIEQYAKQFSIENMLKKYLLLYDQIKHI